MNSTTTYEISEVASECGIASDIIQHFINSEWIQPIDPQNLLLDEEDIYRIQLIIDLKENLGANDESISIILYLIDQLKHLHVKLTRKT